MRGFPFFIEMSFFAESESGSPSPPAFALSLGEADSVRFVSSREKLADELGCSLRLVGSMLSAPGNPGRTQNGSYDVREWKAYFSKRGDEREADNFPAASREEMASVKLREMRAKAEIAELNAAQRRGELVDLATVQKEATEFSARLRAFHHRELTVEAVNVLTVKLALEDAQVAALVDFMEEFHFEFCKKVSEWKTDALVNVPETS